MDQLIQLVELFKKSDITQHVLEKELSLFMGDRCEVYVVNDASVNTPQSFGIFTTPEFRSNGIYIKFFIDYNALMNFYVPEQLIAILSDIKNMKQKIIKHIFDFVKETEHNVVTRGDATSELLKIYLLTYNSLMIGNPSFLPSKEEILNIINKAENSGITDQDMEDLKINDIIPNEVVAEINKITHESDNLVSIELSLNGCELPTFNLGYQEVRELCNGNKTEYASKSIKYDYNPTTNQ